MNEMIKALYIAWLVDRKIRLDNPVFMTREQAKQQLGQYNYWLSDGHKKAAEFLSRYRTE